MSAADLKDRLVAAWPPGSEQVIDWEDPDGPGPLMEACAKVLHEHGEVQVDALVDDTTPLTATSERLADWERAQGTDQTAIALHGDIEARRAQVTSRLREFGSTLRADDIRAVIQPYLRYANPSEIEIVQAPRAALRTANTWSWTGSETVGAGITQIKITVLDDPRVGPAGAQVDLTFAGAIDLLKLSVSLRMPDTTYFSFAWGTLAKLTADTVRLYFPTAAGRPIFGEWAVELELQTGAEDITQVDLFVEGEGRYGNFPGFNGRGAAIYEWAVLVDPAKLGTGYDLEAAYAAMQRINYASRLASLIVKTTIAMGESYAIPDDDVAIPDACIPA